MKAERDMDDRIIAVEWVEKGATRRIVAGPGYEFQAEGMRHDDGTATITFTLRGEE